MQMPTHFMLGILIQTTLIQILPDQAKWLVFGLIALISLLGHIFLDCIAISTYHPPEAHWDDWFWKGFHLFVYIGAIIIIIIFGREFWWALIWSFMIDLVDWIILRSICKKDPIIHPIIDQIRAALFSWLPTLIEKKGAISGELLMNGGFLWIILVIRPRFYPKSKIEQHPFLP